MVKPINLDKSAAQTELQEMRAMLKMLQDQLAESNAANAAKAEALAETQKQLELAKAAKVRNAARRGTGRQPFNGMSSTEFLRYVGTLDEEGATVSALLAIWGLPDADAKKCLATGIWVAGATQATQMRSGATWTALTESERQDKALCQKKGAAAPATLDREQLAFLQSRLDLVHSELGKASVAVTAISPSVPESSTTETVAA